MTTSHIKNCITGNFVRSEKTLQAMNKELQYRAEREKWERVSALRTAAMHAWVLEHAAEDAANNAARGERPNGEPMTESEKKDRLTILRLQRLAKQFPRISLRKALESDKKS